MQVLQDVDREMGSWYAAMHPDSRIYQALIVGLPLPNRCRASILNDNFVLRQGDRVLESVKIATPEQMLTVLREHFTLSFPPGTAFGVGRDVPWPNKPIPRM